MLNTVFGNSYYDPYIISPYDYEILRREEELRRRRAAELAYRRRLEEEMRLRREAELYQLAQLKEEQKRRNYKAMLLERMREEEIAKERRAEELARMRRGEAFRSSSLFDDDMLSTRSKVNDGEYLVRARDGRLYRVPAKLFDKIKEHEASSEASSVGSSPDEASTFPSAKAQEEENTTRALACGKEDGKEVPNVDSKSGSFKKNSLRRRKVTVIVEDASDSETEDDEMKSYWRNRRPSPGQWMEPVLQM